MALLLIPSLPISVRRGEGGRGVGVRSKEFAAVESEVEMKEQCQEHY